MASSAQVRTRTRSRPAAPDRGGAESLSRGDWIRAAWEMLGDGSLDTVRVEPLAKKLGVTKGSFYWHFKDRQQLIDALLDHWFTIWEEAPEPMPDLPADERIWQLFERVIRRGTRGQTVSLRLWSHHDRRVARRIEARDRDRLAFLVEQFMALGFGEEDAVVRGQVYQALLSGEYLRSGGLPLDERLARARRHHELLVVPPPDGIVSIR